MDSATRWLYRVTGKAKAYVAVLAVLQAAQGVVGVVFALALRNVVDDAVAGNADAFWRSVAFTVALVVCQVALSMLVRWLQELARSTIENLLKQRLVNNVLRKEYSAVSATHTAEWINRLTNDTSVVSNGFVEILPGAVGTVVQLVSAVVMVIVLDPMFAAILVPGGIAMCALAYGFRRVLKRLHKDIQERDGHLRVLLQEHLGNLMIVKSYAAEGQSSSAAAQAMEGHKAARMRRNRFSNIANGGLLAAMRGMYLLAVVYCAYGIMAGTVSYGTLVAVMQLVGQIQGPFVNISGYLPRYYASTASAERLMEVECLAGDEPARDAGQVRRFYREQLHALGLQDARFSYETGDGAPVVLDGISVQVAKGQRVAFTGHSGCGKSTVLKLLMCMYPLAGGNRYLDADGGRVPLDASWRRLFAYVPQGNALMNGTIREVVSFACPDAAHDEARLRRALRVSCADEFVDNLDAVLGERGSGLSEGQMQRLAVARAVFSGCPVLLLDESTSALDEATERRLLENLGLLADVTVVIVTHRKAALSICDRVLHFTESGIQDVTGQVRAFGNDV